MNMTWPHMSDLRFWQSEGAQLYAVNSIPHTVLIDGSGKIIARGLHGEELQANAGSFKVAYRMFPKNPELPHRQDFCYVRWFI